MPSREKEGFKFKPMKPPTVASLKKVTAENLSRLGAERLAEILVSVAGSRPELKRRLRMELAADQGAEHLLREIDKRLVSLATSRSRVLWRQRPAFIGEVDGLRGLISQRLANLEPAVALDHMWRFMEVSRTVGSRIKDRDNELAAVFLRAAGDIGVLIGGADDTRHLSQLVEAMVRDTRLWAEWLPATLATSSTALGRSCPSSHTD